MFLTSSNLRWAVISSNAEMLQKGGGLSDEQTEQVENIRYATKRLANLIQNMLKLNKPGKADDSANAGSF